MRLNNLGIISITLLVELKMEPAASDLVGELVESLAQASGSISRDGGRELGIE